MARKINVKLILELRKAGLSRNMIAATRHMSKNSVGDVIHISDERGITYDDVSSLDEDAVYRMFYPDKHATEICITNRIMNTSTKNSYWRDIEAPLAGISGKMQG